MDCQQYAQSYSPEWLCAGDESRPTTRSRGGSAAPQPALLKTPSTSEIRAQLLKKRKLSSRSSDEENCSDNKQHHQPEAKKKNTENSVNDRPASIPVHITKDSMSDNMKKSDSHDVSVGTTAEHKKYLTKVGKSWSLKGSRVILRTGYIQGRLHMMISVKSRGLNEEIYDQVFLTPDEYFALRRLYANIAESHDFNEVYLTPSGFKEGSYSAKKYASVETCIYDTEENEHLNCFIFKSQMINDQPCKCTATLNESEFKELDKVLN